MLKTRHFAKSFCLMCRVYYNTNYEFDSMTEEKWSPITPCAPNCEICLHVECHSYSYVPFDCNFPEMRVQCLMCKYYCRYVYSKSGLTIESVNLDYIHLLVNRLHGKYCCLIKSPFPHRQSDRHCKRCIIRSRR